MFSNQPQIYFKRNRFNEQARVKTSFNVGQLVPLPPIEVLPGDTWNCHRKIVLRLSSPLYKPLMDNLECHVRHFFVPLRLLYDKYDHVFGNPNPSQWSTDGTEDFPSFPDTNAAGGVSAHSVGDYLGLPVGVSLQGLSVLPYRAFALIYNYYYRNQNVTDETLIQKGEWNSREYGNTSAWSPSNYTGMLPYVNKSKDIFTSCLPSPQKGSPVTIPMYGTLPVIALPELNALGGTFKLGNNLESPVSVTGYLGTDSNGTVQQYSTTRGSSSVAISSSNLGVRLDDGGNITVNDLRMAVAVQRYLELSAQYGDRVNEIYRSHFGVWNPDILAYPEYLGGSSFPIEMNQAVSLVATPDTDTDGLGDLGAYSLTNGDSHFVKSFTEHGYIMTCLCVKQKTHTYSQGVHRLWNRKGRLQFYDPVFSHISEQPIYKGEVFNPTGVRKVDFENAFGYQEAWAEYRYLPSVVTGGFKGTDTSAPMFATWALTDRYTSAPVLSEEFCKETPLYLDQCLRVKSSAKDQFIVDTVLYCKSVKVMPVRSTPGLVDHVTTEDLT